MTHPTIHSLREDSRARLAADERELVLYAIRECRGQLRDIARWLDVCVTTAQQLIRRHGLSAEYREVTTGPGRPRKVVSE